MRNFAVVGFPVKHSFSPSYFKDKFEKESIEDAVYTAIEVADISDIKQVVKTHNLVGFNVTVPHKQTILPFLDGMSEAAKVIGAVNTVTVSEGKLYGDNTDYIGFRKSIRSLLRSGFQSALIFGTGGSSLAVKFALDQLGVLYSSVSRGKGGDYTYADLDEEVMRENSLLINTTPLGMTPRLAECVDIPFEFLSKRHLCIDLIYTPAETLFLEKARTRGARVKNGLEMLHLQADEAWNIWNS
jgi:shikimate dehydrogenase